MDQETQKGLVGTIVDAVARRYGFVRKEDPGRAARVAALINATGGLGFGSSLTSSDKSYSQLVDAYRSWVYTSIDRIAKSIASLKLRVFVYRASGSRAKVLLPWNLRMELKELGNDVQRKVFLRTKGLEREEVDDHPVLELLQNPNPNMTRFILWYETMVRLELSGSCGWYMPMTRVGTPGEIWPLPLTKTATLEPVVSPGAEIVLWKYKDGSLNTTIPPEEVIFHRYPHPGSPFKGMSPLLAQTEPYDIDLYIARAQKHLFENRAIVGLNLHTKEILSPEQAAEIKEFLDAQYAGVVNAGANLVTHSGLEAKSIAMTNKDAVIGEVAKYAREKLITAYDLSEGKLGLVSDVNRANMEALNETYVMDCMRPKTMMIEEAIEARLLPLYDAGLTADFVLPDTSNREADRLDMEARIKNLITTVNEEREMLGRDPAPWGDLPWVPQGVAQFGSEPAEEPMPDGDEEDGKVLPQLPPMNVYVDVDARAPKRKVIHVRRNKDGTLSGETVDEEIVAEGGNGDGRVPSVGRDA